MAQFYEEEPEDWAEEQRAHEQQAEDGPPEEFQPEPWEVAAEAAAQVQGERLPADYDPSAPNSRGGCRNCDSFTVDHLWREAFGVYLCVRALLSASATHSRLFILLSR